MTISKFNKKDSLTQVAFLIIWSIYFYCFYYFFYVEAMLYVDYKSTFIIQLIFLTSYYLKEIFIFLIIAFVIMTLNLLTLLLLCVRKREGEKGLTRTIYGTVFSLVFVVICLMFNILRLYFIVLTIVSLTIIYIIYVVTKRLYATEFIDFEETNKVEGPFETLEEAEEYKEIFYRYWTNKLDTENLHAKYDFMQKKDNKWYVEIRISQDTQMKSSEVTEGRN